MEMRPCVRFVFVRHVVGVSMYPMRVECFSPVYSVIHSDYACHVGIGVAVANVLKKVLGFLFRFCWVFDVNLFRIWI